MPKSLLKEIEEVRKKERYKPSRSAWIVAELTAAVKQARLMRGESFQVVGESQGAGAGDPSGPSMLAPPAALGGDQETAKAAEAPAKHSRALPFKPRTAHSRDAAKHIAKRKKS